MPRWCRSSSRAESALSSFGQCRFLSGPKLAACVSQAVDFGSPLATEGQLTCTKRVPASIRRRASSADCPNVCRPYRSRIFAGSLVRSNALRALPERMRPSAFW